MLTEPATLWLEAIATDDEKIGRVEFVVGETILAQSEQFPHTHVWSNMTGGVHHVTARAVDNDGAVGVSQPVQVRVRTRYLPAGSLWKYKDDGSAPAASWKEMAYDDSLWATGPAPLGYGNGDEATTVEEVLRVTEATI